MRPHLLQFGGIGTYPQDTEIDFDALSTLGLYLIVGPTGAGKSTIFDALTYALFGKVPGERPDGTIVSDHANRVTPYINLEFTHRNIRYRVQRKPSINEKSPKPGDQVLIEYNADGSEARRVTAAKKVTDEIVRLIGLDAQQFMRVILLPQNEFRKFLLADSNEKVGLLRALFGTTLYETIASRLDISAKSYYTAARDAETAVTVQEETARNAMTTLRDFGFFEEVPEEFNIQNFIALVEPLAAAAKQDADSATEALTKATAELATAEADAIRFDAHVRRKEVLAFIEADKAVTQDAANSVQFHERAKPLTEYRDGLVELEDEVEGCDEEIKEIRTELVEILDGCDESLFSSITNGFDAASAADLAAAVSSTSHQLGTYLERLSRREELEKAVADNSERTKSAQTEIDSLLQQQEEISQNRAKADAFVADMRIAVSRFPALQVAVRELQELLAKANVDVAHGALVLATSEHTKATAKYQEAEAAVSQAMAERTKHLAGELAQGLEENQECPVCGSTSHPAKAVPSTDVDPSKLQAARDKAFGEMTRCENLVADAQNALELAQANAAALPSQADQDSLLAELKTTEDSANKLEEEQTTALALAASLEAIAKKISAATVVRDTANNAAASAIAELAKGFDVPEGVTLAAIQDATAILKRIEKPVASLVELEKQKTQLQAAAKQAEKQLETALSTNGFLKIDDALTYILKVEDLNNYQSILRVHTERTDELMRLEGTIGTNPLPSVRPDVDALAEVKRSALELNSAASAKSSTLGTKLHDLNNVKKQLESIGPEAASIRERAREAQAMSDVIRLGRRGVLSLEKWVQRTLFEEVCDVASLQISTLSSGRYRLTLEGEGQRTGNRTEGLDIFVIDSHTGKTRAVQTLSGGEQFLTSLALALALAEVVQRHSGGIEMSSLFIDEGFGSLDADNLEIAVDVLRSLQDSGRTVGVISHVESMQQELNVGIRVTRSPSGSSLEVLV